VSGKRIDTRIDQAGDAVVDAPADNGISDKPAASPARDARAGLPSVDRLISRPEIAALVGAHGRGLVLTVVREVLAAHRPQLAMPPSSDIDDPAIDLVKAITTRLQALMADSLRPVLNLTGTVLHTNLGRAPLPPEALEAITRVASGASNLEFDLTTGRRGERDDHVAQWLCRLTGAPAAAVVNNNAAAVVLLLNALALRREVIVSRGELIELGGSFRLPDIMLRAGCRLREVGTTNRTHLRDFAEAIGPQTALIMKVHASNYRIEGFTAEPDERELAALARSHDIPFVIDLGSGTLTDLTRFGLPDEPTPEQALANGADLVTFSGDKLLGGPQAGMLVGRTDLIDRIRRNPLKRAMRCDKLTIAALAAVLRLYGNPERLVERIPALRQLARPSPPIEALAQRVAPVVARWLDTRARVTVASMYSQIGSGSLPLDTLPSFGLRIEPLATKRASGSALGRLATELRNLPTPVIGRVSDGALWLDLRCIEDEAAFIRLFEPHAAP
jgi:L-seryl-tRNA(Ser) seleniumtransferase